MWLPQRNCSSKVFLVQLFSRSLQRKKSDGVTMSHLFAVFSTSVQSHCGQQFLVARNLYSHGKYSVIIPRFIGFRDLWRMTQFSICFHGNFHRSIMVFLLILCISIKIDEKKVNTHLDELFPGSHVSYKAIIFISNYIFVSRLNT